MPLDESSIPNKRSRYTSDQLPGIIYVASVNYVSNFNPPSDPPHYILLSYDAPSTEHTIIRDKPGCVKEKILLLYMRH